MTLLLQGLISGISVGAIYGLLALSYTMIYGTLNVAHYAQGNLFMVGMLIAYQFSVILGWPFWLTILLTTACVVAVILILERIVYRPMLSGSGVYLFMCTIGMSIFIQNLAQLFFGNESFAFPSLFGDLNIRLGNGLTIVPQNLAILVVTVIIIVALTLYLKLTKMGIAIKAVSMNRRAASLMGIKFSKVSAVTYGISGAIVAIASVFTAPVFQVNVNVGSVGLKALIAALLGGFGNIYGAILGGVLLGVIETLGSLYISSAYKDIFSFGILILVLIFRPQGLLGAKRITKV